MNRLSLAFRSWWKSLTDPEAARRIESALVPAAEGPDLRILALLQREGRLVDFLLEEIEPYSDAQIGAAVRNIHRDCRKALRDCLAFDPVVTEPEDQRITVPAAFDPNAIRLLGNVAGAPPFQGVVKHQGWKVRALRTPQLTQTRAGDATVLAPAEVEVL